MERIGNVAVDAVVDGLIAHVAGGPVLLRQETDGLVHRHAGVSTVVRDVEKDVGAELALHADPPALLSRRLEVAWGEGKAAAGEGSQPESIAIGGVERHRKPRRSPGGSAAPLPFPPA